MTASPIAAATAAATTAAATTAAAAAAAEEAAFAPLGPWRDWADYRAALIIPVDPMGRVLLQLRDHHPNAANPGQWGLFGGEAERGETLAQAAAREMEEELGVALPAAAFTPFARIVSARSRKRLYAFTAAIAFGPEAIRLGEGAGFGFIEPRDFARLDLVAAVRVILAAWRGRPDLPSPP